MFLCKKCIFEPSFNLNQRIINKEDENKNLTYYVPVQNISDEALASILSYIAQRDAVTDYSTYYGALVNAMVRSKYSEDEVEAIVCNVLADKITEEHKNEWLAFQDYRKDCKARAKTIIDMMTA